VKTRSNTVASRKWVYVLGAIIATASAVLWMHERTAVFPTHEIESAHHQLTETCEDIRSLESDYGEPAPSDPAKLVQWMKMHMGGEPLYTKNGILLDPWDHPVVVLTSDGKVTGLGSAGPDGVWQGGTGDDIVVKLGPPIGSRPAGHVD
jgi:hypothetical protein